MSFWNTLKGWINKLLKKDVQETLGVKVLLSSEMEAAINMWDNIVKGRPAWRDEEDFIISLNFAKTICEERARLITLDINITADGSPRADFINTKLQDVVKKLRRNLAEKACSSSGVMMKPNSDGTISYIDNKNFFITDYDSDDNITGAIFADFIERDEYMYTRLEYHRFESYEEKTYYRISNRFFRSDNGGDIGKEIVGALVPVEWRKIEPDLTIENIERPLFAYFKTSGANHIDDSSPLGVSVFSNALNELKMLDIAWSRMGTEIEDSKHITFVSKAMQKYADGGKTKLPRFVQDLFITGSKGGLGASSSDIHEHTATLLTKERIEGINEALSFIGYKCGFDNGHFVFNEKTGFVTATQVESDKERTIQTIKDDRDMLQDAIDSLIYAMDKVIPRDIVPLGTIDYECHFGDITYNFEEDKKEHWSMVLTGKYPLKLYLIKYDKKSEDEADEIIQMNKEERRQEEFFDD